MWGSLKFIYPYFKSERINFFLTLFLCISLSITGISFPLILGKFYQLSLNTKSLRGQFLDSFQLGSSPEYSLLFLFILLIFSRLIITYFLNRISFKISSNITHQLINELYEAQIQSNWARFSEKAYGKYLSRYSGQLRSIRLFIEIGIIRFIADTIFLLLCFSLLIYIDYTMSLIVISGILIFLIPLAILQNNQYRISDSIRDKKSARLAFIQESFSDFFTNWIFNKNKLKSKKLNRKSEKILFDSIKRNKYQSTSGALLKVFPWVILFLLMAFVLLNKGQLKNQDTLIVLVFFMLIINISSVLRRILRVKLIWKNAANSILKLSNWIYNKNTNQIGIELPSKKATSLSISMNVGLNKKFVTIEIGQNAEITLPSHKDVKSFISSLGTLSTNNQLRVTLNDIVVSEKDAYDFRKSVTFISRSLPPSGKTILESLTYSIDSKSESQILNFYASIYFPAPSLNEMPVHEEWTLEEYFCFQVCRAWLTNKPFIFVEEDFEQYIELKSPRLHQTIWNLFTGKSIIRLKTQKF